MADQPHAFVEEAPSSPTRGVRATRPLREFLAAQHMPQGPPPPDEYVTMRWLASRFSVTTMTLHRWRHDPRLDFPAPLTIRSRKYWKLADILEWERQRAAGRGE